MKKTKSEIGRRGEDLAQEYLERQGFTLLHRNWRNGRYEIDLVMEKADTLHIVEVKTRVAGNPTSPEEAFTRAKFRHLCRAAEDYVQIFNELREVQFDLVAIEHDTASGRCALRYIPAVMSPTW